MELQKIVVLCLVGAVVAIGGWYVLTQPERDDAAQTNSDGENQQTADSPQAGERGVERGVGSLESLLGLEENYHCTFSYSDEDSGTVDGEVYVAGERMRGTFSMMHEGSQYEMHMLQNNEYTYTWGASPGGRMAIRMQHMSTQSGETETQVSATAETNGSVDLSQEVAYSCTPWAADESTFVPPSDVEFQHMDEMMRMNLDASSAQFRAAQCSACDDMNNAETKAQCRAALGC